VILNPKPKPKPKPNPNQVLPVHNGANVYVRSTAGICTDTDNGAQPAYISPISPLNLP